MGTTTVNVTATDASGNVTTGSFTVTVVNTVPPTISLPASPDVQATSGTGAMVTLPQATAIDLVDPVVSYYPSSGFFPVGTTLVTVTATDSDGDISISTFTVTVNPVATAITLVDNGPKRSTYGQSVSFTVSVSSNVGVAIPDGETLNLEDASNGDAIVATGTFENDSATINVSNLNAGSHSLFAYYAGDATNGASQSSTVTQAVNPRPLFIEAVTSTKYYDGTTTAAAMPVVIGLQGSDTIAGLREAYINPTIGTGKILVPSGTVVDGNSGTNYAATFVNNSSGVITPDPIHQSILFTVTSPVIYGLAPITLSASGGASRNPVTFSVISGPGTLNGNNLTLFGVGSIVIQADQAASAGYAAAPPVQQTLVVDSANQYALSENENGTPASVTVSNLLGTHYSDPDGSANTKPGIAIVQMGGKGNWQDSANGSTWTNISSASQAHALLLPASYSLRFAPAQNSSGQAQVLFFAWDGSQGSAGSFFNITATGGTSPFSTNGAMLSVTVNPVLTWAGSGAALPPLLPGTYSTSNASTPAGSSIAAVFAAYFQDNVTAAPVGVAVTGVTGTTSGTWQYSTNGSLTWNPFPAVSSTSALLLSASDLIRFVPKSGFAGTVALTALAWDGSAGTHGTTVNPSKLSSSAFSTNTLTATCSVNNAPTLSTIALTLPSLPDNTTGAAVTVSTLLTQAGYHDPDGNSLPKGIALVGTSAAAPGSWQYMVADGSWQPVPAVSSAAALLLQSTASLRFVSNNQLATATLTFRGWDQTQAAAGATFNIVSSGGANAFTTASATLGITVRQTVNWSASTSASLTALLPGTYSTANTTTPAGNTIVSIFGSFFQSNNPAIPPGVAVVGLTDTTSGTWQYAITGSTSWTTFPIMSSTSALLLSANDQIRFVPNSGFTGTVSMTALAWDGSAGTHGTTDNPSKLSSTAFSTTMLNADCIVNTAPVLSVTSVALAAVNENVTSPAVSAGTLLSKAGYSDADGKTVPSGIAIIGNTGLGSWQWLHGATWTLLPAVSSNLALLLPSAGHLRFQPANNLPRNTSSTATLTFLAWDQTAGVANKTYTLTGLGGTTAFSAAAATASMTVNSFKQAPAWAPGGRASFTPVLGFSASNPSPNPVGDTVVSVFGNLFTDVPGIAVGVAITGQTGTTVGTWQFSTNGGVSWQPVPATVSATKPLLLSANDRLRFVPGKSFSGTVALTVKAWNGDTGLSARTLTPTCLVNTAPALTP